MADASTPGKTIPLRDSQAFKQGLFFVVGMVVMVASLVEAASTEQFLQRALPASGTVIPPLNANTSPDISFKTFDGKTTRYPQNGLIGSYSVGDKVTLLYDPQDPQQAQVNSWSALWGFTLLTFLLGAAFVATAVVLRLRAA